MRIFISYAHADAAEFAQRIRSQLVMAGHSAFFDSDSIEPGAEWQVSIDNAIISAEYFLAILTPRSIASSACRSEIASAQANHKSIIPMLYRDCDIPQDLARIQYIDFRNDSEFAPKFERLLYTLTTSRVPAAPTNQPWRQRPAKSFGAHISRQPVHCITKNTRLAEAYNMMYQTDFVFRHLLVTSDGQIGSPLEGILSLRHIIKRQSRNKVMTFELMDAYNPVEDAPRNFAVLRENDPLEQVLKKFTMRLERRAAAGRFFYMSAIPVIDENGGAVGIVSFKDILQHVGSLLPVPDVLVGDVMRDDTRISYSVPDDTFADANLDLTRYGPGQRDIPVVENRQNMKLLGLIPDHEFISNFDFLIKIGSYIVPLGKLKTQHKQTPLKQMIEQYMSGDISKLYYSFPVTESVHNPRLVGLIGYREIFEALLQA